MAAAATNRLVLAAFVLAVAGVGGRGWAAEDEPVEAPSLPAPPAVEVPAVEAPTTAAEPPSAGAPSVQRLAPVEVVAPRVFGPTGGGANEASTTALRQVTPTFDVPAAVTVLEADDLRLRRASRSLSNALEGVPGVMVQKTAPLQHSPFIRGLTGYYTLLLIDGVRLNHSAMRSGPNQYWSTVDAYTIGSLEVVRGPHSVLYGSDAVGGTVDVHPWRREFCGSGTGFGGRYLTRYATAEDAWFHRGEFEGHRGNFAFAGGVSFKTYGTIESGDGSLPGTGGAEEFDADLRVDWLLNRHWKATVAWQHVEQRDAPRTEQTVDAVPFRGTTVGSELRRDFDQDRDLVYARLAFDACGCAPIRRGHITLSWHNHREERDRLRTAGRRDLSGFDLDQYGVALQLESPLSWGSLTYGAEYYRDEVDTWRRNYLAGVFVGEEVQGPLGDDGTYDLGGAYAEWHLPLDCWDVYAGARFTYVAAEARRVDNQAVPGEDPTTPGNVIGVENDWTNLAGSLRVVRRLDPCWNAYAAVSQGFRAPSLSDLTAVDSTSVVETPAPGLEPEDFISFEVGLKTEQKNLRGSLAVWTTRFEDSIIRSPTGALVDGVPEVRKDNVGDGHAWGVELEAAWNFHPCWTLLATASWLDGEVDQLDAGGATVRTPLDRLKPLTWLAGVRYAPANARWWGQCEWLHSEKADELSLRDETDLNRIPPGGTPGWDVVNLRFGYKWNRRFETSVALENLFDENYRIHGSGVNEPGRSLVVAAELSF